MKEIVSMSTEDMGVLSHTDLVWVQLALVHWVGVLNDLYLVFAESFPIETLRENMFLISFYLNITNAKHLSKLRRKNLMSDRRRSRRLCCAHLEPVGDFRQLGDGRLFVHKLLLVQVAQF